MTLEIEKGSFGYIKRKKKRQILLVFLMLFIAAAMFITGLFLHKFDKSNLCTMLAILMVLPMAKFFVIYVVMFPYKSVSRERYDSVREKLVSEAELMTDMVITSPDISMNLDFIIITDNRILGLTGKKKQDIKYIEDYLKKTLESNKLEGFTVKIFDDEKQFEKCIPDRQFEKNALQEDARKIIRTLAV